MTGRVAFAVEVQDSAFESEAWAVATISGREVGRRPILAIPKDQGLEPFFDAEVSLLDAVAAVLGEAAAVGDVARAVRPLADFVEFANEHYEPEPGPRRVRPREAPALPYLEDSQGP